MKPRAALLIVGLLALVVWWYLATWIAATFINP